MSADTPSTLLHTPLHALHLELGARMVPFAGYAMPVQYPAGVMAEHRQCRHEAALFDVSHMGQILLRGDGAAAALESLVPVDVVDLGMDRQRYGFFTNARGGLLDDLMITRREDGLLVIVNASCKEADLAHLRAHLGDRCEIVPMFDRALLALQGPMAVHAAARLAPGIEKLAFMSGGFFDVGGVPCYATRSGYTGEDGYEISCAGADADRLARLLLDQPEVKPAGLGARDSLRLEAGLCLYGSDIGEATTPIEAALTWAIQKVRRPGGAREGGYPGADVLAAQFATGALSKRVGLVGLERVPVRAGTVIVDRDGHKLGTVTSGTLAPTVDQPVAMAYLPVDHAILAHEVYAEVRGKRLPMRVSAMPFAPHRYFRG
ncbi:MAG TPA: glycine cleavage system aminomethyltransferase GcvT [Burkholderiaceae bacterium]